MPVNENENKNILIVLLDNFIAFGKSSGNIISPKRIVFSSDEGLEVVEHYIGWENDEMFMVVSGFKLCPLVVNWIGLEVVIEEYLRILNFDYDIASKTFTNIKFEGEK